MNREFAELFDKLYDRELVQCGLVMNDRQKEQFYLFYENLIQWNQVMNLTAITELDEVIVKHFVDSLSLVRAVPDLGDRAEKGCSFIDVGTGAGFPGIPLKIAYPRIRLTLLDSLNKRVKFLNDTTEKLGLDHVTCIHGRAEDGGRNPELREQFDICVSRAVANLSTLSEYCMPFVKTGGFFVPYKSGKLEEEMETGRGALETLGGGIEEIITFRIPNGDERTLVRIKKVKPISKKYPRKAGLPGKEPLR